VARKGNGVRLRPQAARHARPDKTDLPALAIRAWPVLHRLGPLFLGAFQLRAVRAAASTLRAVELLSDTYNSGGKKWPNSLPTSFLRPAWRDAVRHVASKGGRTWEAATGSVQGTSGLKAGGNRAPSKTS
jgi:hypothetical protein